MTERERATEEVIDIQSTNGSSSSSSNGDTVRLLDRDPERGMPAARPAGPTHRSRMSTLVSILQVFLLLLLRVVLKCWKVCIAELLLVVLVFWVYGGLFAFFLMVAALVTVVYNMQDFLLYFPDNPKGSTLFVPSASILDLPYENLMIKTSDRIKISAVLLKQPPERAARCPTLLFLHGNAGNLGHRLLNAKLLYTMCHCNVLLLDYRGYGKSEGSPSESVMASTKQGRVRGRMLMVGLACVDIVNVCEEYPVEDTDQRLIDQQINRGGNASNTAVVLAQLGSDVEWLGTVGTDKLAEVITEDLDRYGVKCDHARCHENYATALSCVIINDSSGSRTIVHKNKALPEVDLKDFEKLDLGNYSWIHFEGRNLENVAKMIAQIEEWNERRRSNALPPITISFEAEKPKRVTADFLRRIPVDYLFMSKEFSKAQGYHSAEDCLRGMSQKKVLKEGASAICAWGEQGAWGLEESSKLVHSPAFPPIRVVDTLGAGDSFNAGVLLALNSGRSLEQAIEIGCRVAGHKVGRSGFEMDLQELNLKSI